MWLWYLLHFSKIIIGNPFFSTFPWSLHLTEEFYKISSLECYFCWQKAFFFVKRVCSKCACQSLKHHFCIAWTMKETFGVILMICLLVSVVLKKFIGNWYSKCKFFMIWRWFHILTLAEIQAICQFAPKSFKTKTVINWVLIIQFWWNLSCLKLYFLG